MLVQTEPGFPFTPIARIPLQRGFVAFCDPKWLPVLKKVHWYAKKSRGKWYACSKVTNYGKVSFIRMHRVVANTPPDMIAHHLNNNSLDCRSLNLLNVTHFEHAKYFSYR
ncbi:hypothetical protein ES703_123946 [subsurface metagenome]